MHWPAELVQLASGDAVLLLRLCRCEGGRPPRGGALWRLLEDPAVTKARAGGPPVVPRALHTE